MYEIESWFVVNTMLMLAYGLQHSLLTTATAVNAFGKVLPPKLWNISYSLLSIALLCVCFVYWQRSGVVIYALDGFVYWTAVGGMVAALVGFFYCFKFTTSFSQWIGISQVVDIVTRREPPPYYRVRKNGPKRYVRFPHHTCLALLFWSQPVMTLDTLWLAVFATAYTYIGTVHQDSRGRRLIGEEWIRYSENTNLMFPNPLRILSDALAGLRGQRTIQTPGMKGGA